MSTTVASGTSPLGKPASLRQQRKLHGALLLGPRALSSREAAPGNAEKQQSSQVAGGHLGMVSLDFVDHGRPEGKGASTELLGSHPDILEEHL